MALNGTGSGDPDGDILSYSCSQVSGREVSLSDTTAAAPTFTAPPNPGTLEFRLRVTDGRLSASDTTTVTVPDVTPPAIVLSGSTNMTIPAGSPYADPGYAATDNADGDITGAVVVTGTVDTDTPGTYTLYYDVSDSSGNAAATQSRTVTVVDAVPPVITLKGDASITMPMGPTFTDPGYTATDNIDGNVTGMVTVTGTVDPLISGTYVISYEVTGSSGNTGRQTRTVTVSPPTDPTQYCDGMTLAQLMASGKYNIMNMMFSPESTIQGTSAADLIITGGNGPTIEGKDGNDCIIGGVGNDMIWGRDGYDMIFGNGGDDVLRGGAGDDTIWGQGGNDTIHGGDNSDTMYGGAGNDQMWGLGGNDTIHGDAGDDTIYAGPGIDTIYGGPGIDTIEGGEHDTIHDDNNDNGGSDG